MNRVLIVTGASMGIGRAVSLDLAKAGYALVLNARTKEPLEEIVSNCQNEGVQATAVSGDAGDQMVGRRLVDEAHRLGDFNGFIYAAGVFYPGNYLWEIKPERVTEMLDANLVGPLNLIRAALPALLRRGSGLVVLLGSGVTQFNIPGVGVYAAAKAAEEFLGLQLATEAPEIKTVVFRPWQAETRMQQAGRSAEGGSGPALQAAYRSFQEKGVVWSPEAVAASLMKVIVAPEKYHGKIVDARDI